MGEQRLMPRHRQAKIIIKEAAVDIPMIPVVRWLNRWPTIITTGSCQGDERGDGVNTPGISFVALTPHALNKVIRYLGGDPGVTIEVRRFGDDWTVWKGEYAEVRKLGGKIHYHLEFKDLAAVERFVSEKLYGEA